MCPRYVLRLTSLTRQSKKLDSVNLDMNSAVRSVKTRRLDSDAEISGDLRAEVYRMLKDGATDDEIKEFMVARHGRHVLYNPPLDKHTLILWFGPAAFDPRWYCRITYPAIEKST